MLLLVLADNYLGLYMGGWEGVGLASYLLIGFWSYKPSAATAAKKRRSWSTGSVTWVWPSR